MDTTINFEYIKTNGITLHVAQAGDPDAPLVLLLHGFPEFWYGWREQIPYLVEQGYRVWCPDQRGYNYSDKPSGIENYRLDLLTADVIGLIDAAGVDQVYLVGHDWGGGAAWWTALHYPERLKKLVILNSPHPAVMRDHVLNNPRQLLRSFYMFIFQIPLLPETLATLGGGWMVMDALYRTSKPGTFTDTDVPYYTKAWTQPGAMTAMLNWYRALPPQQHLTFDLRCKVPTLLLWGAKDQMLGEELVQPSLALCDQGQLELLREASHWVQHEEPARVNALISAFLKN